MPEAVDEGSACKPNGLSSNRPRINECQCLEEDIFAIESNSATNCNKYLQKISYIFILSPLIFKGFHKPFASAVS